MKVEFGMGNGECGILRPENGATEDDGKNQKTIQGLTK